MPSSGGSSPCRYQPHVTFIAGGFFTAKPPGKPRYLHIILYIILFLGIQKEVNSKLICEYFSVYNVHHFLADKRSGILHLHCTLAFLYLFQVFSGISVMHFAALVLKLSVPTTRPQVLWPHFLIV